MAKTKAKASANGSVNRIQDKDFGSSSKVSLSPIKRLRVVVPVKSTSSLIMHKWSEKAKQMMRDKQQKGVKTKNREIRVPEEEAMQATYTTVDGDVGLPALAFKASLIGAAHKDIGIEKTLVRKALFIRCDDPNMVIPFSDSAEPSIREDMVRVGAGSSDLRYRPEFTYWKAEIEFELDGELLQPKDLLCLVSRAGFGVGICEWRPEKGGEFGRYEIDSSIPFTAEEF